MSAEGIAKVIQVLADDMYALIITILEDDSISNNTKVNRNTLKDSALRDNVVVAANNVIGADPVLGALFNDYVGYLEWDRPPRYKKQPPIDALKDWAEKNGIPTDADTLWKISYAIWRDGHTGRPIFATMDKELDKLFMDDWADKLRDAILEDLDNLFND